MRMRACGRMFAVVGCVRRYYNCSFGVAVLRMIALIVRLNVEVDRRRH